jgi:tRNA-Thr(GGU) m(6)t(6)A37 methyltransferase TsaA
MDTHYQGDQLMGKKTDGRTGTYEVHPIGYVRSAESGSYLEVLEPFRPALKQLDQFSHVIVVWWADRHDDEQSRSMMQCKPPYAADKLTGVFACRAEYRPNPVAITVCKMVTVDDAQGVIPVEYIDAYDGTPILDLKAYFPVCDRVRDARMPEWLSGWPEWVEDGQLLTF